MRESRVLGTPPESPVAVPNGWDRLRTLLAVERAARELNDMAHHDLPEWYGDEDWPQFDDLDAALKALDALSLSPAPEQEKP